MFCMGSFWISLENSVKSINDNLYCREVEDNLFYGENFSHEKILGMSGFLGIGF